MTRQHVTESAYHGTDTSFTKNKHDLIISVTSQVMTQVVLYFKLDAYTLWDAK